MKLIFNSKDAAVRFSHVLFRQLEMHSDWMKNCDYHIRKNVLYFDHCNYSCLINFVHNYARTYGYEIED